MSKVVNIYSTKNDLAAVILAIESMRDISYIPAGLFSSVPELCEGSLSNVDGFGVASSLDQNHNPRFLGVPSSCSVRARAITQRDGTERYSIDQIALPASIVIRSGGVYNESCVIAGQLGTTSDDDWSLSTFRITADLVKSHFHRIKSYFVGGEARCLLRKGYRLTADGRTTSDFDLTE